jgi:hypothetical protein
MVKGFLDFLVDNCSAEFGVMAHAPHATVTYVAKTAGFKDLYDTLVGE